MIHATPVAVLQDNYVWIVHRDGDRRAVAVDPGDGAPVGRFLVANQLDLAAILLTHHHADHVGGVAELLARDPTPVYGPARETIAGVDHPVGDGDRVEVGGLAFEVLEVPGHTAGHVAYVGEGVLLSGDTLFAGGCGRLFEGTAEEMARSLARLASLDPATAVCCAHEYTLANLRFAREVEPGNREVLDRLAATETLRAARRPTLPSTLDLELRTNPFLRCREPAVAAAAARVAGRRLADEVAVFAAVRRWKDGWRG